MTQSLLAAISRATVAYLGSSGPTRPKAVRWLKKQIQITTAGKAATVSVRLVEGVGKTA